MKKYFILIIFIVTNVFAQEDNLGVVIEFNNLQEITFTTYNPPLRINQVSEQSLIDYTKIKGLIQSYYSASNKDWAMSEYLDKREKIIRDKEHFVAVKSTDIKKNYIQIETIYEFDLELKKMAYIKYAFVIDKMPFPIIGIMSAQKVDNKWYISDLLNQYEVNSIFSNFETSILTQLFSGESDDEFMRSLIRKTMNEDDFFDLYKIIKIYDNWSKTDSDEKRKVMDKRLLIEGYPFKNAVVNTSSVKRKYKVSHPFILEKAEFSAYEKGDRELIKNEKTDEKYKNKPELLLLGDTPITLIHKFNFSLGGTEYSIIKYFDNILKSVTIRHSANTFEKVDKYKSWGMLFLNIKTDGFIRLFKDDINDKTAIEIRKYCKGTVSGINIDLLSQYIKVNKNKLGDILEN